MIIILQLAVFIKTFKKYFKISKDCQSNGCDDGGLAIRNCPSGVYKNSRSTVGFCMSWQANDMFVLDNNMLVMVSYAGLNWMNAPHGGPVSISIDVNGYKNKPNIYGKDVFIFELLAGDKLIPAGSSIQGRFWGGNLCSKNAIADDRYNGAGCAYYAMTDKSPDDPQKSYWNDFLQ